MNSGNYLLTIVLVVIILTRDGTVTGTSSYSVCRNVGHFCRRSKHLQLVWSLFPFPDKRGQRGTNFLNLFHSSRVKKSNLLAVFHDKSRAGENFDSVNFCKLQIVANCALVTFLIGKEILLWSFVFYKL